MLVRVQPAAQLPLQVLMPTRNWKLMDKDTCISEQATKYHAAARRCHLAGIHFGLPRLWQRTDPEQDWHPQEQEGYSSNAYSQAAMRSIADIFGSLLPSFGSLKAVGREESRVQATVNQMLPTRKSSRRGIPS
jgi:hypothetical protein